MCEQRCEDALLFARAALRDFEAAAPGAAEDAGEMRRLIGGLGL